MKYYIKKFVSKIIFRIMAVILALAAVLAGFVLCCQNIWRQPYKELSADDIYMVQYSLHYAVGNNELYWPLPEGADTEAFVALMQKVKIKGFPVNSQRLPSYAGAGMSFIVTEKTGEDYVKTEYGYYGSVDDYYFVIDHKYYKADNAVGELIDFLLSYRETGRKEYYDFMVELFKSGNARYLLPYEQWDTAEVQTALNPD